MPTGLMLVSAMACSGLPSQALADLSSAPQTLAEDDFSAYLGLGLHHAPTGELDSDLWRVDGFSEGATVFGSVVSGGDFGRGIATGGVSSGGLYAFDINGDVAVGVQSTGSDFTPGSLTRRVPYTGLEPLGSFGVDYELSVRNEGDRSSRWVLDWSLDNGASWHLLEGGVHDTAEAADDDPHWQAVDFSLQTDLAALELAWLPGTDLLLRWGADDLSGSGGRDEVALDDIRVYAPLSTPPAPVPLPPALMLMSCALAAVVIKRPVSSRSRPHPAR
ncbi:MAG: hypothetical protein KDK91_16060 [Gammaproteobacteria bacterium]|nr:hypothetical protein [Gammaproteobacteria bacterium]